MVESFASLPARGAWIETDTSCCVTANSAGRSPRGERGLKLTYAQLQSLLGSRSPRGERGLKQIPLIVLDKFGMSLPARGAWIETCFVVRATRRPARRSPRGERGLKRSKAGTGTGTEGGRSPRGERGLKPTRAKLPEIPRPVAPRAGSVD